MRLAVLRQGVISIRKRERWRLRTPVASVRANCCCRFRFCCCCCCCSLFTVLRTPPAQGNARHRRQKSTACCSGVHVSTPVSECACARLSNVCTPVRRFVQRFSLLHIYVTLATLYSLANLLVCRCPSRAKTLGCCYFVLASATP